MRERKWSWGVTVVDDLEDEWLFGLSWYRSPETALGRSYMLSLVVGRRRFHIGRHIVRRRPRRKRLPRLIDGERNTESNGQNVDSK